MARPRLASKRSASSLAERTRPGSLREAISQRGAVVLNAAISAAPVRVERGALLHGALLEEDRDAVVARHAGRAVGVELHQPLRGRRVPALAGLAIQADRGADLRLQLQLARPRIEFADRPLRLGQARQRGARGRGLFDAKRW